MSLVIGLTGPTGAGKSSVTSVAEELGFKVIDCDKVARIAVEKGSDGLIAVTKVFGNDILNEDGSLNRAELARKAFSTQENTELLNKTVFPYITDLVKQEITDDKVLLDAPTLFESGIDNMCDEVIAIISDEKTRLERIMERDGIDADAAMLRIKAGKDDNFYMEKTDNIVYNDCEISVLKLKIQKLITKILEEHNNV